MRSVFMIAFEVILNFIIVWFSGVLGLKRKDCGGGRVYCYLQSPPPAWPGRAIPDFEKNNWNTPKPITVLGSTGSIGTQVQL